jgi:cytidine deaminase
MKEIILETKLKVFPVAGLPEGYKELVQSAVSAAAHAYAPYSHFHVGAAVLLDNGKTLCGSNQENAAYPSGLCAERVALFYAGSRYPGTGIRAIAVAAETTGRQAALITPCGACRQVLLETQARSGHPVEVLLCGAEQVYVVEDAATLLPLAFDGSDLPSDHRFIQSTT